MGLGRTVILIVFTLLLVSAQVAVGQTTQDLFGLHLKPVRGGLEITQVDDPSSAATNGLEEGDIIRGLDGATPAEGIPLPDVDTLLQFSEAFLLDASKGAVKLWIKRGTTSFSVTLPRSTVAAPPAPPTPALTLPFKATPVPGGLRVDLYTATDGQLRDGDIITQVIGSNVRLNSQAVLEAEAAAHQNANNEVQLLVKRTIKLASAVMSLPLAATPITGGLRVDSYTAKDGQLRAGDIITTVVGSKVPLTSPAVLQAEAAAHQDVNNEVRLLVKRPPSKVASSKTIKLSPLPAPVRLANPGLTYTKTPRGLKISDLVPDSRATMGLQYDLEDGFVIVKLNDATAIGLTEQKINALLAKPNVRVTFSEDEADMNEYTTVLP